MDQFKKYLRENREELDIETAPPAPVWQQAKIVTSGSKFGVLKLLAAASVAAVITSALFMWLQKPSGDIGVEPQVALSDTNKNSHTRDSITRGLASVSEAEKPVTGEQVIANKTEIKTESPKKPEIVSTKTSQKAKPKGSALRSLETNYATIISYQLKRIERTPIYAEGPDYFHVFKKQWYDLEKDEEKIRHDVQSYGLTDFVVDQFIQLYQNKIALLKQLQTEIDKMNLRARNYPELRNQTPTYLKM